MKTIAIMLRALQFGAHNAHNLAKGPTFMEDHEHFADLYGAYEGEYDDVVERMIGLRVGIDLIYINKMAMDLAASMDTSSSSASFSAILAADKNLMAAVEAESGSASLGSQDLLQKIADACERRQYKIQQRLDI